MAVHRPVMEALELRQLLSVSPTHEIFHPTFRRLHAVVANETPAGVSAPSGITPAQMRTAYGLSGLTFGSVTGDGSGQTIAIVDAYNEPTLSSDVKAFDNYYGFTALSSLTQVNENGGTTLPSSDAQGGWGIETALDVEWAHVMAPGAKILLVEATTASDSDLFSAVGEARNYAGVSAVSMSWGGDESSSDSSEDSLFTTPSGHQGVTFISSSGDNGAYSDTGSSTKIVGYPPASPNVVGVGGTTLTIGTNGSYVSESGWGNGSRSSASGGSGGGISNYAAQPSYQSGVVTQSTTRRTVPDLSLDADPNSGVAIYSAYDNGSTTPWETIGGTSLSSPMFAGIMAVVNQGRVNAGLTTLDGPSQTLPKLYSLPAADYHDITTGNNGYAAGTGYDLVTGRGTPIGSAFVMDLAGIGPTPTPSIGTFAVNPTSVTAGTAITLTASNVTETGGTVSAVKFYCETNGVSGLQTTGTVDTLVGAGTQSGTTWSLSGVSTTGFTSGTTTFYTVAFDTPDSTTSPVVSAALTVGAPTPAIGSFAVNPTSITAGASAGITLTASNVTEAGGTVSAVSLYLESNGTSGLQVGSDTLIGAATQNGSTWTYSGYSAASLSAGTYTVYAQAMDNTNSTSSTASTTLTVSVPVVTGVLADWNVFSQSAFGTQGLGATNVATGLTNSTGLTRGSGVSTVPTGASRAWGGNGWNSSSAAGITNNEFVTFGFTVGSGYSATLSSIDLDYRRSSSGPANGYWQDQMNGGPWNLIGDFSSEFSSSSSSGAAITEIPLSGLSSLAAGSVVNFRVVPYGATGSGGTWYVYNTSATSTSNDLTINGSVSPVVAASPTIGSFGIAPASVVSGQSITMTAGNVTESGGSISSVNFYRESNSIAGLQTTGTTPDTLVGTGTQSGSSWSISTNTTGLSAGTYTYYAVATDGSSVSSTASSATVGVTIAAAPLSLTGPGDYLELDSDGTHVDIWNSTTNAGTPSQQVLLSQITTMSYTGGSGNDSLTVDFSNGNPLVSTGISYDGGAGGTNALNIIGTADEDTFIANGNSVGVTTRFGTEQITYTNTTGISITAGDGVNQITQAAVPGAPITLMDPSAVDNVDVYAGTFTFPAGTAGLTPISLDTLHIEAGATVNVASATSHSLRSVLVLNTLEDDGTLDLMDNDLILHQGDYTNIHSVLGTNIISGTANSNPSHLTTLALIQNNDGYGNAIFGYAAARGAFDGQDANVSDLIIKYTYYGDADLSGSVDGTDYSRIDNGYLSNATGWFNGDFNGDGFVDGSDYTLIDNAFNAQGTTLTPASHVVTTFNPRTFPNWSAIGPAIAMIPQSIGPLANVSVVNFGTTVYTGPLNVTNTLNRIRADGNPIRSDDGGVYTNPQASGLPVDGTYYEFTIDPSTGTNMNFGSQIAFPGPMRLLLATGGDLFFTGDHYSTFTTMYLGGQSSPTIGAFAVSPTSVATGTSVTLTASNVAESGGTISSVSFYRESNGTSGLQVGSDTLIGTGTQSGTTWSISTSTTGLSAGTYTYYAVATDSSSFSSAASSTTLTVTGAALPTIGAFSDNPTSVVAGGSTTLTASGVTETGGTISSVMFYRESNSTPGLQIGSDTLLGTGSQSGTTWTLSTSTTGLTAGTYTYYAVATDASNVSTAASSTSLMVTAPVVPTIATFAANPATIAVGGSTTLAAAGVTETGGQGTVTAVNFYRESNGTSGLQIGSDLLVGSGAQSGTSWSLTTSAVGLVAGTYTYYAVAVDSNSLSSATSTASLVVSNNTTSGSVLAWDVNGQNGFGSQGLAASNFSSGISNSAGLTRGSGISTSGTAATNAWGGHGFSTTTSTAGINAGEFLTFGLTVSSGFNFSASSVDLNYRRSSSGPVNGLWQYELNNGSWTTVSDVANEFSSTSTSGTAMTELNLASVTGLQSLSAGTSLQFRLVPYGATSTGGTWYIYNLPGNDLNLNGTLTTA